MSHWNEEQITAYVFDHTVPDPSTADHLASCQYCQAQVAEWQLLAADLGAYVQSQPSPTALQQYKAAFEHLQTSSSPLQKIVEWLQLDLLWDGRQYSPQGVRGPARFAYRLFYATNRVEIDVMVTPRPVGLDVEGEVLPTQLSDDLPPMMMLFENSGDPSTVYTAESSPQGRFRLEGIQPGNYTLWLTPPVGAVLALEGFELR
jgi:hypothetical protein